MLTDGKLNAYWIQDDNNVQAAADLYQAYPGFQPRELHHRVGGYPTVTTMAADLVLPAAMWSRRKAPSAMRSGVRSSGTGTSAGGGGVGPVAALEFSKRFGWRKSG